MMNAAELAREYPVMAAFIERVWLDGFSERQVRVILDMLTYVGVDDDRTLDSWASVMAYLDADDMLRAMASLIQPDAVARQDGGR